MKHDLLLLPLPRCRLPPISVLWDEDAGTFVGRDSERVREFVYQASKAGSVAIEPHPTSFELGANPAKSRADLGAILGRYFILPTLLAEAFAAALAADTTEPDDDSGDDDSPGIVRTY